MIKNTMSINKNLMSEDKKRVYDELILVNNHYVNLSHNGCAINMMEKQLNNLDERHYRLPNRCRSFIDKSDSTDINIIKMELNISGEIMKKFNNMLHLNDSYNDIIRCISHLQEIVDDDTRITHQEIKDEFIRAKTEAYEFIERAKCLLEIIREKESEIHFD